MGSDPLLMSCDGKIFSLFGTAPVEYLRLTSPDQPFLNRSAIICTCPIVNLFARSVSRSQIMPPIRISNDLFDGR